MRDQLDKMQKAKIARLDLEAHAAALRITTLEAESQKWMEAYEGVCKKHNALLAENARLRADADAWRRAIQLARAECGRVIDSLRFDINDPDGNWILGGAEGSLLDFMAWRMDRLLEGKTDKAQRPYEGTGAELGEGGE